MMTTTSFLNYYMLKYEYIYYILTSNSLRLQAIERYIPANMT